MSRMAETIKTIERTQAKLAECLPLLEAADKIFCVEGGFCGTAPASYIHDAIRRIKVLIETEPRKIIEWH